MRTNERATFSISVRSAVSENTTLRDYLNFSTIIGETMKIFYYIGDEIDQS